MMKISKYKSLLLIVTILFIGSQELIWSQKKIINKATITVAGFVKDTEGNPISNAKIYGNQGDIETNTDEKGAFSLQANVDSYYLVEAKGYNSIFEYLPVRCVASSELSRFALEPVKNILYPSSWIRRMKRSHPTTFWISSMNMTLRPG